ncbi:MAG: methionine adenosyltransferase domain-containing protein, partial [Bacteroidota bacterium]
GKDPSKVDRSAAYATRHVAKNLVAAGLADEALVQVAYAIGVPDPVSIRVETNGTGTLPDARLAEIVTEAVDLRPAAITARFGLIDLDAAVRPRYRTTAAYGHFGREGFPWERLDLVDAFQAAASEAVAA